MSNILSSPNFRRGAAALSMVATVYAGSIACSGPEAANPGQPTKTNLNKSFCDPVIDTGCELDAPYQNDGTLPADAATTSTTLSPEMQKLNDAKVQREAAENYVKSPERNERIDSLVQEAGQRFIVACQTGEAGPCDVYSGMNDKWRSQTTGPIKAGWAWLQHGPNYGGKDIQFGATVWVDEKWNIDASKGIKGVHISDANGSYEFTAPGGDPGVSKDGEPSPYIVHPNSWETKAVRSVDGTTKIESASESYAYDAAVLDLQIVDETAISLLDNFQEMHNLQPVVPPKVSI